MMLHLPYIALSVRNVPVADERRDGDRYGRALQTPTYGYVWRGPLAEEMEQWGNANMNSYVTAMSAAAGRMSTGAATGTANAAMYGVAGEGTGMGSGGDGPASGRMWVVRAAQRLAADVLPVGSREASVEYNVRERERRAGGAAAAATMATVRQGGSTGSDGSGRVVSTTAVSLVGDSTERDGRSRSRGRAGRERAGRRRDDDAEYARQVRHVREQMRVMLRPTWDAAAGGGSEMSLDEWLDECTMRWLERENDRVREQNGEGDELQWWERFDAAGEGGMDEEQRRGLGRWIEACTQRWLSSVGVGGGACAWRVAVYGRKRTRRNGGDGQGRECGPASRGRVDLAVRGCTGKGASHGLADRRDVRDERDGTRYGAVRARSRAFRGETCLACGGATGRGPCKGGPAWLRRPREPRGGPVSGALSGGEGPG